MTLAIAAATLAFAAGARAGDDVQVLRGPLAPGDGVAITGAVHADGAKSVRLAVIRRDWTSPQGWSSSWCHGVPSELTLKDGDRFRVEGLVPGTFDIGAFAEGFADAKCSIDAFAAVTDADLRLLPAATVRIAVKLAFEGKVEQTSVQVVGPDGLIHGYGRPKDGVVEVAGLAPGRCWITAEHAGDDCRFTAEKLREVALSVELKPGANDVAVTVPESADVRFLAHSVVRAETVEGVVRCREAPEWQVDAPFRVRWPREKPRDGISGMFSGGVGRYWQEPGARLPIRGLSNGTWTLTVDALGFAPWERKVVVEDRTDLDADLTPLPGRYVVLPVSSSGRRDIAYYADVRPESGGEWKPLLTEDDRFLPSDVGVGLSTRAFLAPGKYVVSVHTPIDPPSRQVVDVTDDRSTVTLEWKPAAESRTFRGRTTTRGGAVASGFLVHCLVRDGDAWRPLRAKAAVVKDGAFEIRGLPPGVVRLAFDEAGKFQFGDVEIGDEDVEREFVVGPR